MRDKTLVKVEQASKNSQTDTWAKNTTGLEVGITLSKGTIHPKNSFIYLNTC